MDKNDDDANIDDDDDDDTETEIYQQNRSFTMYKGVH